MARSLATLLLLFSTALSSGFAFAAQAGFEEGTHYVRLTHPVETSDPSRIEVMEYFSYACPHCFTFDPMLGAWEHDLAEDVTFERTPAIFNRMYQWFAQVYYTADVLGVQDRAHTPLFRLLHEQREMPNSIDKLADFFGRFGVERDDFESTFKSIGVRSKLQQAVARGQAYQKGGVNGVPTIIVDGEYIVDSQRAGGYEGMLAVTDFLIEKLRAEREAASRTTTAQTSD